jgi:hypothetical protein
VFDGEVSRAGCAFVEGLVGSQSVVGVAEQVDFDGEGVAVADGGAVEVDTWWPSARIIAAILRCPQAGQSAAYFAATASIASTLGAGHGPFGGSSTRWRASRRQ